MFHFFKLPTQYPLRNKIAILYNCFSAKGKGKRMALELHQLYKEHTILFENIWPGSLDDFEEIWLVGGDGTVNFFINQYPDSQIPLIIFPGGTGNDIHWKLYGKINWHHQYQQITQYQSREVDLWICNDRLFVNGVGIGFDGEVLKSMKSIRWIGGHLGYLLVVIRKIFTFKEPEYTISINQQSFQQKCMLLSIANSSRTGGGFLVSPLAEINDGILNMFYCEPLSILKRLITLPKVEKGLHLGLPFIHHQMLTSVSIQHQGPIAAQIDGELMIYEAFNISISPKKLLVKY